MSLWIDVTSASSGKPITDALFGTSAGNVSAFNEGNGWYYAQIDPNTTFTLRDQLNQYYSASANTDGYTAMSMALAPIPPAPKQGW
jgi:hypothetical protein